MLTEDISVPKKKMGFFAVSLFFFSAGAWVDNELNCLASDMVRLSDSVLKGTGFLLVFLIWGKRLHSLAMPPQLVTIDTPGTFGACCHGFGAGEWGKLNLLTRFFRPAL